jgi:16S rRNA processing protein RimM
VLGRVRGNKGEITAASFSSKPDRFEQLGTVRLFGEKADNPEGEAIDIERVWNHDGVLVFKFKDVDTIAAAERLRGSEVRIPETERVTLESGEYFQSDLIGCEMRDCASNRLIGKVTGWAEYGGPALLEIDNGRLLVPFVRTICIDIRPGERLVRANLPEGLEDL